ILDRGKIVEWNDDGSPRRAVGTHMDVTERKNAERELRRQRDLLRQTQRLAGAWEHDLESGVIHWSEEVYRILEWPPDKPVHLEQLLDLFLPKARTQLRAAIQAAIEDGVPYDLELPLLTLEGTRRWVRAVGAPTRRGGEVVKLAGALQDITERKETEEEIRRQRDLLENIFDASPAAIVTLNAKGQFTSASARGQEVLGLAPAAVSGRAFNDPEWRITDAHGRSMPVEELPFARVLATNAPTHDVEMSIERSDGTRRLLSVSGAPLQGANGQPDGAVFVLDDITEKKRRTSMEQRLGQLLKATPSEIYVFDAETLQFVQTSRGARRNLGYAADELATMTPLDLKPYDRADFEAQLQPLRTDTEELVTFETTHRRKDGTTYPVEVRLQLSREETRPVFIAIALDITERTRRERELVDAKERAEEMSRLKSAFLANMSHEIRTPLTSIIGFADVLGGQVEGTTRELIGMIRESGKRLEETLTSVLDLAKIEGESMRVRPDRVDLAEEVRTAAGIFRPKAEAKGLNLEVDVPTGPTAATLDPRVLRRILSNLVSNAVKFTSEGRVTVRLRPSGDNRATIEVEDTGIGIAEEQMTHIFDEFVQESAGFTREYEGVGLGLSITRRLVQLLGGTVEAESEKGRGSIFRVRLPREHPGGADGADELPSSEQFVEDAPPVKTPPVKTPPDTEPSAREETDGEAMPPLGARPEASPAGERTAEGDTVRILLVEDNALTRRVLPMLLQKADARYTMDVVERGEDALKQAEARGYDLFIIDINLGAGLTGLDVMRRLRKLPRYAQTPMVACTAYAMPGDEEQFLAAGFDAYLAKPFRAEDLLTALARAAD
ncbi:MAG: PAS domain S-box protein, partial [Bacteroidetes bacterium]|nr:PAS domain S-box protein [Bacteroidota bacterium]